MPPRIDKRDYKDFQDFYNSENVHNFYPTCFTNFVKHSEFSAGLKGLMNNDKLAR